MEQKSIEKRIKEKTDTISELESQIMMAMELFQNMSSHYGEIYATDKGKTVNPAHISGFSTLLNSINGLQRTKNEIQNEINSIVDYANQDSQESEDDNTTEASKSDVLKMISGDSDGEEDTN